MRIDMIRVELGYALLPLAAGDQPKLTEQIRALRRSIASEMGFVLPPVRIQDNLQLGAEQYVVKIKEIEAGRGELRALMLLAMDPKGGVPDLPGERTTRAGIRPARDLDRPDAARGGPGTQLHGSRSAERAGHAPDRTGARHDAGTVVLRRNAKAARRFAAGTTETRIRPGPGADFDRRRAARAAGAAGRTGIDPRFADHPGGHSRSLRRPGARHCRHRRYRTHAPGPAALRQPRGGGRCAAADRAERRNGRRLSRNRWWGRPRTGSLPWRRANSATSCAGSARFSTRPRRTRPCC